MRKITQIVFSSILAAILGLIISQIVLPPFFAIYNPVLDSMGLLDRSSLITYAGILITFLGFFIVSLVFNRYFDLKQMLLILILSGFLSFVLLGAGSWIYVSLRFPGALADTDLYLRLIKLGSYPVIITLKLADPQPIWVISIVLFLIIFSISIILLTEEM